MTEQLRAGVLGHPISHSLSPALHRAAYDALGLTSWRYDAFDVTENELVPFLDGLDAQWRGLSLTMPLKRAVLPLLDHIEPLAELTGSVNTVLFSGDGSAQLRVGANTDIFGIVAAIRARYDELGSEAPTQPQGVVIGAGATAASALAALGELGCVNPTIYLRSRGRAGSLIRAAERMGLSPRWEPFENAVHATAADIVISTVPAGAGDSLAAGLALRTGEKPVLLDVVYAPWPTELAKAWPGPVIPGAMMLLHQAAEQVRLMTGKAAPLEAMAAALA